MPNLCITNHAIERYQQRVDDVSPTEVVRRLNSDAIRAAADFGAPYVRLPGGQRVVINDGRIVTVLPKDHTAGSLGTGRDYLHNRGARGAAG